MPIHANAKAEKAYRVHTEARELIKRKMVDDFAELINKHINLLTATSSSGFQYIELLFHALSYDILLESNERTTDKKKQAEMILIILNAKCRHSSPKYHSYFSLNKKIVAHLVEALGDNDPTVNKIRAAILSYELENS